MSKDKEKNGFFSLFGKKKRKQPVKVEKTIKIVKETALSSESGSNDEPIISKITVQDVDGKLHVRKSRKKDINLDDHDFEADRHASIVMSKSQKSDNADIEESQSRITSEPVSTLKKAEKSNKLKNSRKKDKTGKSKKRSADNAKITDIREARKKKKQKKRVKKLIFIGFLAVFGISVYASKDLWIPKLEGILDRPHDTIVNDGKIQKGNFPIKLNESSVTAITHIDNSMIRVDDNHIVLYNESGTATETFNHNYAEPIVQVSGKRILVYDLGGNSFEVLNKKNQVYEKKIDKPVLMAAISSDSKVAVVTQNEKYAGNITVYDENGSEIYAWSSAQRILDVSFTKNGDGCYISTFDASGGEMKSVIHKISLNSTEEVMTSQPLNTLALDVSVNDAGDYWVVGDSKFYKLDKNGAVLIEYDYPGEMVSFDTGSTCAAVAFKGIQRASGSLAVFSSDSDSAGPGNVIYTNGGVPKKLSVEDKKIILLSNNTIDAYDISGNLLATAAVSSEYTDFTFFNENVYFMGFREINKIVFKT